MPDCGPLGGMYTSLRYFNKQTQPIDAVLFVPCDTVELPAHFIETMLNALQDNDLVYARDNQRDQQLYCLIKCSLQEDLFAYLTAGGRKVMDWFAQHKSVAVGFERFIFLNMNTPKDWEGFNAKNN